MTKPMTLEVRLRATYREYWFDDDSDDPNEESGYTSVSNPWGGFHTEMPPEICGDDARRWVAENVETVTVNLIEAATIVREFPGGVWDYSEGEPEQDYQTGHWISVTLHVQDHAETVFELADRNLDQYI